MRVIQQDFNIPLFKKPYQLIKESINNDYFYGENSFPQIGEPNISE